MLLREYAALVLKLSVFVGVAINLAHQKQAKAMRLALGLILLSAIMLPLVDIISTNHFEFDVVIPDIDIDTEVNDGAVKTAFEEGIEKYICSLYELRDDEVKVMADDFDFSSMTAKRIYVTLSGAGVYIDYRRLENDLASEFTRGGVCEVELDI